MKYKLKVIISSVRPGRKGPIVARWITDVAGSKEDFEVEVLDLAAIKLPLMDEAAHPRLKKYEHKHTRDWSARIAEADAFIFVTAEYNHSYPAPLRNALEYLVEEWGYKPAAIVSYGGVSAGTRAAANLKCDLTALKIVPLYEAVNLPFFDQFINDQQELVANEATVKAADNMLKELLRWTRGLKQIRDDR